MELQLGYGVVMIAYWLSKIGLRRRCLRRCPDDTLSLLPSALVPWHYLGCAREGTSVKVFGVNGFSGEISDEETIAVLDAEHTHVLEDLPEYRAMRELSPAYHLVSRETNGEGTKLVCRDLRTRNFKTRFGQLDLELTPAGTVENLVFHV